MPTEGPRLAAWLDEQVRALPPDVPYDRRCQYREQMAQTLTGRMLHLLDQRDAFMHRVRDAVRR